MAHSAIGREGLEVYDGGWIRILNGGLQVIGTATISGTLDVTGTTNLKGQTSVTGPMEISGTTNITGNTNILGELNVTGPTTLDGVLDIGGDTTITGTLSVDGPTTISGKLDVTGAMSTKGTLSVEGVTTLKNDLNVTTGGKIKAGNLEIEPANGGQINFTGGSLSAGQFGALLNNTTAVELQAPTVKLNTSNVNINSLPTKPASELTPVGIDSAGRLHRIA
ncbi:hypothetical protein AOZ07_12465 [Glutamicibacter halophytocola]|nr:hypothetical protein AOZ07_12465 [Glutamicibacter halophytocola]